MTSKEFKALKAELTHKARLVVIQRKPNTCVVVEVEHNGLRYVDFGFSKVNWPDWFLPRRGKEIALGRAVDAVAARIIGDVPREAEYPEFYVDFVLAPSVTIDFDPRRVLNEMLSATGS